MCGLTSPSDFMDDKSVFYTQIMGITASKFGYDYD